MQLKNIIKNIPIIKNVNERLKQCKFVHLMFNDKFNKPFVDFLNRNFNPKEHLILCKRWIKDENKAPFPVGENVLEIYSIWGLDLNSENIQKIICHSFFDKELINYLYKHADLLKNKAYWVMWGGDLYNAKRDKINDYVRKNCKGYLGVMDREYALGKYSMNDNFYNVHYPFSTTILNQEQNSEIKKSKDNDIIRIQINNSCDGSTLEVLDMLSKFKDKNIKVTTVLSYGDMQYKDKIIEKGRQIFKEKFEYLSDFLEPNEYRNYIKNNDVLILNQNRQQGVGNIIISVQYGNKIFIRNNISTYKFLNETDNVKIFDTCSISELSWEDFIRNDFVEQNINNIKQFTDEDTLAKLWMAVFNG